MKGVILFFLIYFSLTYIFYKIAKATRTIAYNETEEMLETVIYHIVVLLLSIGWAVYFSV